MSYSFNVVVFPWAMGCCFPACIQVGLDVSAGVGSRIGGDHMRTAVCLPSRTGTHIVDSADIINVIIETEGKPRILIGFRKINDLLAGAEQRIAQFVTA